jgi:hypothetical protein
MLSSRAKQYRSVVVAAAATSTSSNALHVKTTIQRASLALLIRLIEYQDLASKLAPVCLQPLLAQLFDDNGRIDDDICGALLGLRCSVSANDTRKVLDKVVEEAIKRKTVDILKVFDFIRDLVTTAAMAEDSLSLVPVTEAICMRSLILQGLHGAAPESIRNAAFDCARSLFEGTQCSWTVELELESRGQFVGEHTPIIIKTIVDHH